MSCSTSGFIVYFTPVGINEMAEKPKKWRNIALVMSTAFCIGVILGLFPALIALNVENLGFDTAWNGLLAAMPALAGIAVGSFVPRIVARLGALRTYVLAVSLAIVSVCLFPVFTDLTAWFVIRFVMGVGIGVQWIVSEMWVNRLAIGPRRGLVLSVYVVVLSVGLSVGPLIMSVLGTQGARPFYVTATFLAVSCLPLFFASGPSASESLASRPLSLAAAFLRKPSAMLAGVVDGFVFQTLMVFLPLYFIRLGTSETVAINMLTAFFAGGIILQFIVGYMLDRLSPAIVLIGCCILLIMGLAVMADIRNTIFMIWIVLLVLGGAGAAIYTSGLASINDAFSVEEMPSGTAMFSTLWYLGGLAGPATAGFAMEWWNPYGMAAVVALAAMVLATANAFTLSLDYASGASE
jgi:MFS family permease